MLWRKGKLFGYHGLMLGEAASVMPLLGLALPLISSVRRLKVPQAF
jgi:hypothetical protein